MEPVVHIMDEPACSQSKKTPFLGILLIILTPVVYNCVFRPVVTAHFAINVIDFSACSETGGHGLAKYFHPIAHDLTRPSTTSK